MKKLNLETEFDIKAVGDKGVFEGYASINNNVDLGMDIIEPYAFKEIVTGRNGKVKILYQHNTHDPIGTAEVTEDDKGLSFKGELILGSTSGKSAYELMKGGALDGMSIGYDVLKGGSEFLENGIRKLSALKLWEISPVTFGMNPLAGILSVKDIQLKTVRDCENWLRDEFSMTNGVAKEFIKQLKKAIQQGDLNRDDDEAEMKDALTFLSTLKRKQNEKHN